MKNSSPENERHSFFGRQTLAQGAITIAFFTILSGLLGLFRDRLFASKFFVSKIGLASQSLDVYYAAFFIPDTIYYLIFLGALAAAFIPVFTSYISKKQEKEAFYIANAFLNLAILALVVIGVAIFFLAPFLVKLIAPGFDIEKQKLTASLIRIMLLSPLFFGISNTAGGILNSYKRFTVFAIAPCLYNLGIIFGTIAFYNRWAIYAPAIGVLIGAFLHMAIQFSSIYFLGYRYKPIFDFRHSAVRRIFKLMLPRMAALAVDRVNRWIFLIIASTLAVGSVSIINLSSNLQAFPVSFFGVAVATATFPFLAEAVSLKRNHEFSQNFSKGLRYILYLIIPASILIILLRVQIVRIILGAGYFGWTDTRLTAACLGIFSLSLFAQGIIPLLCRSFYALSDTYTPFKLALTTVAVNLLGSLLFTRQFFMEPFLSFLKLKDHFDARVVGLSLAFTLSSILYMALLYKKLKTKTGPLESGFSQTIWKIILAGVVMGIFVQAAKYLVGASVDLNKGINVFIQFGVAACLGVIVYFGITFIMKLEETQKILGKMKGFLRIKEVGKL